MTASARSSPRRSDVGLLPLSEKDALLGELSGWYEAVWSQLGSEAKSPDTFIAFVDRQLADAPPDPDNLRALAMCAFRLDCVEAARDLAQRSLADREPHPRALCILGLCELRMGNTKAALSALAQASRLARARPEWRAELHLAQRLLILTQFR